MLERYITDTEAVPISILTKFWADQAASITYKEIRKMIEDGDVSKEDLENWSKDYSILVEESWLRFGKKLSSLARSGT